MRDPMIKIYEGDEKAKKKKIFYSIRAKKRWAFVIFNENKFLEKREKKIKKNNL